MDVPAPIWRLFEIGSRYQLPRIPVEWTNQTYSGHLRDMYTSCRCSVTGVGQFTLGGIVSELWFDELTPEVRLNKWPKVADGNASRFC